MRIEYSVQAASDVENIKDYYWDKVGPEIAIDLLERITVTLERLIQRNPKSGRSRDDLGPNIRMFPVLPYLIFYRTAHGRVYVVRILHGHRDIRPPLSSLLVAV
jgi:toxin ParE1/3/4